MRGRPISADTAAVLDALVRLTDTIVSTSAMTNVRIDAMSERIERLGAEMHNGFGQLIDSIADLRVALIEHTRNGHDHPDD